jgi:hypothetical protein
LNNETTEVRKGKERKIREKILLGETIKVLKSLAKKEEEEEEKEDRRRSLGKKEELGNKQNRK